MSASRERRERQQQRADGVYTDKRIIKRKKAKVQDTITRWVVGVFVGIIACTLVLLFLMGQGVPQRALNAAKIGDEPIKVNEFAFHYYLSYSNFVNTYGDYMSYLGIDTSIPLEGQQSWTEGLTWKEYFTDEALNSLKETVAMSQQAKAEGLGLTNEDYAVVDNYISQLQTEATNAGKTLSQTITTIFGKGVTVDSLTATLSRILLAERWRAVEMGTYTFSDEEVEDYYNSDRGTYDVVSYQSLTMSGDHDEEAADHSDEEHEAALQDAHDRAEQMLGAATASNFYEMALKYCDESVRETMAETENSTLRTDVYLSTTAGTDLGDWLSDTARQPGDKTVIDSDGSYTVALFLSRQREESPSVDVRHILIGYNADLTAAASESEATAALERAEQLLAEWKSGSATEDSFAALAGANTMDGGSQQTGGLYTGVMKGDMVAGFDSWIFDPARQPGDTDIVETDFGYHIMYFVKHGDPAWQTKIRSTLTNNTFGARIEEMLTHYPLTRSTFGMRFA